MNHQSTSVTTSPASARTDVLVHPTPAARGMRPATIRRLGVGLAVGTVAWAATSAVTGFDTKDGTGIVLEDLSGLLFQCGVMGLLHVQMATRATGTRKVNRRMLQVERVLLSLAMVWSVAHALLPGQRDATWMGVLDAFWPISMLGMFLIGVKIAFRGRWRGPARLWSLLAETWAVVTVPVIGIFGRDAGDVVGVGHLLLGYTVLGVLIAARPDLVEDRG